MSAGAHPMVRGDASGDGGIALARGGRLAEFLAGLPPVTLSVLVACVAVFIACEAGDFDGAMDVLAIRPSAVLRGEAWRLVTAAFVHAGLLHIAMNGASLLALGGSMEPLLGSSAFSCLLALYTLLVSGLYVGLSLTVAAVMQDISYLQVSAVGFSGVLFALAVDEAALAPAPRRTVFGLFSVPTRLYPWVLMGLLQVLLPNLSLLGHLAGLFAGSLHAAGALNWTLPSLPALRRAEQASACAPLARLRAWHRVPERDITQRMPGVGVCDSARQAAAGLRAAAVPLTQALSACFCRVTAATVAATGGYGAAATNVPPQPLNGTGGIALAAVSAPAAANSEVAIARGGGDSGDNGFLASSSDSAQAAAVAAARVRAARSGTLVRRETSGESPLLFSPPLGLASSVPSSASAPNKCCGDTAVDCSQLDSQAGEDEEETARLVT